MTAIDRLLTADEVADLLRVKTGWIYSQTRAGRIPHLRLGRYVRYRESAVLAWMEALEAASIGRGGSFRSPLPSG
jgi:excisionase family DNA binding protein